MTAIAARTLVVIGNGMVGHRFVEQLVDAGAARDWNVVVFGEEPRPAYDRIHLSSLFQGRSVADLTLPALSGIELRCGDPVIEVDTERRAVRTASGREQPYDALVIATGSKPFVPPIPGADGPDCFVYRTIEDVEAIRARAAGCRRGAVIGGGLLGLEAAGALNAAGLETHVVELAPRLMAVQLDDGGGAVLRRWIEGLGVAVHTGVRTEAIAGGRLMFSDGAELAVDMVVFSAGIRPRDELARAAGLALGARGGIAVDDRCRTSAPDVYAIGECAAWNDAIYGLAAPGYHMARVAASQIVGDGELLFEGADLSTKLKLLDVDVASFGDAHGRAPGSRSYAFSDEVNGVYKRIVVSEDGAVLLGGMLVGDVSDYELLCQIAAGHVAMPAQAEQLLLPADAAQKPTLGGAVLADTAQVCQCNNVSKGGLCERVRCGDTTLGALKASTRAGTTCGGCVPLVTQILKAELAATGAAVDDRLCEHFPHTRQELYHLVRVHEIRTFTELIARHGDGIGCEVCKPAVTSILAACWNEHILDPAHAGLQDSNDYFLANLQRDGSYSVVPRVPGGEITPDKLIAIGTVAKRYDLYTKITGGQRVDLFGARVHQLPAIWAELIDAGFESGHAYGKALRTVKTCVGTTWCRYGVQDAVGIGIRLENRYKGLRAPHKIKMAVSGCARECAEAQSKDVGVIATELGYNLYVCGNGGMKPRHADLFAVDLDEPTLVRLIDRFLMFYIRTADRLQRTARWLEGIEGGLDYVKAVVIDDSLGIADELERDMARVVGTYKCEWRAAIEDERIRARFRTFVNDDAEDDTLVYVRERGQRRPAYGGER